MTAHVLVVDDEPDVETLIKRRFRQKIRSGDLTFSFAADGVEALDMITRHGDQFDMLLCDINMPRMDGLTLLDRLQHGDPSLKAVMVSAYGDIKNIRAAMNAGAFDFVTKPIDFEDLSVTIDKTLRELELLREAFDKRIKAEAAKANLERYFSPSIVETLANRSDPFGDVRSQKVAVLFVDIVGFTAIAEAMSPGQVMALLRDFHARVEAAVFDNDGLMEKYIGDAALAVFGAPDQGERDAVNALNCAREILLGVSELNEQRRAAMEKPIKIGIGLNYGDAVMGDIGNHRNAAFAVVGDTVNTGSRLQDLTRILACDLAASDAFVAAVHQQAGTEAGDMLAGFEAHEPLALKGRQQKVLVWTHSSIEDGNIT